MCNPALLIFNKQRQISAVGGLLCSKIENGNRRTDMHVLWHTKSANLGDANRINISEKKVAKE